jgi:peroxiredoxin
MAEPAVGARFPPLALETKGNATVRVPDDFRGRNVLLSWYPFAFSPVCTEEFTGFRRVHAELDHLRTTVLAVSCDHWYSAEAYKQQLGAPFPFLSDWTKENARKLGILVPEKGASRRMLYLLDGDGVLRWQRAYEWRDCPKVDDFLVELKKLA